MPYCVCCWGRDKRIHLFGPAGFLDNVAGKLKGYTWNLVHNYEESLTIVATEIHPDGMLRQTFQCRDGFDGNEKQRLPVLPKPFGKRAGSRS